MDTGILSIILHLLPYQFRGLGILSTIMFTFNVGLFAIFSCIGLARLFLFTEHARNQAISMIEETSYLAAPCVAYLTLVGQVSLTCSTAWGHGWTIAAYVFWWIGMAWTVTLCSATVVILTKRSITDDRNIVPAIFLPLISVMTAGTTGGIVVNYSYHISARMAVPVIIVSYMCIGYALFLSIMFYSVYLHRLMTEGPPQFAKTPTMIITVCPRPSRPSHSCLSVLTESHLAGRTTRSIRHSHTSPWHRGVHQSRLLPISQGHVPRSISRFSRIGSRHAARFAGCRVCLLLDYCGLVHRDRSHAA